MPNIMLPGNNIGVNTGQSIVVCDGLCPMRKNDNLLLFAAERADASLATEVCRPRQIICSAIGLLARQLKFFGNAIVTISPTDFSQPKAYALFSGHDRLP
jgi:hypothetical protein